MQEVYDFLKACGTYYLATVEGDQPRVRPFGTIDMLEGYPELAGMYQPGDGNNVVMYMKDATAYFCSFQSEPKVISF